MEIKMKPFINPLLPKQKTWNEEGEKQGSPVFWFSLENTAPPSSRTLPVGAPGTWPAASQMAQRAQGREGEDQLLSVPSLEPQP